MTTLLKSKLPRRHIICRICAAQSQQSESVYTTQNMVDPCNILCFFKLVFFSPEVDLLYLTGLGARNQASVPTMSSDDELFASHAIGIPDIDMVGLL
jgi:hypothetical protein